MRLATLSSAYNDVPLAAHSSAFNDFCSVPVEHGGPLKMPMLPAMLATLPFLLSIVYYQF